MAQLIWAPKALQDLELIFEYIQLDSPDNARSFIRQLIEEAAQITEFPLAGRKVTEYKDKKVREKLYRNYRIIYRIREVHIEIVTIVHQSRRIGSTIGN